MKWNCSINFNVLVDVHAHEITIYNYKILIKQHNSITTTMYLYKESYTCIKVLRIRLTDGLTYYNTSFFWSSNPFIVLLYNIARTEHKAGKTGSHTTYMYMYTPAWALVPWAWTARAKETKWNKISTHCRLRGMIFWENARSDQLTSIKF